MKMTTAHSSARTLTSLSSCRVSGLTISSPRYGTCSGIDLQRSFPNGFFDPRLVDRDDGLAAELADEGPDPDAADADQRGQVHPRPGEMPAVPRWRDQPIDDDVAHRDYD